MTRSQGAERKRDQAQDKTGCEKKRWPRYTGGAPVRYTGGAFDPHAQSGFAMDEISAFAFVTTRSVLPLMNFIVSLYPYRFLLCLRLMTAPPKVWLYTICRSHEESASPGGSPNFPSGQPIAPLSFDISIPTASCFASS